MFPPVKDEVPHSTLLLVALFIKHEVMSIEDVWPYLQSRPMRPEESEGEEQDKKSSGEGMEVD